QLHAPAGGLRAIERLGALAAREHRRRLARGREELVAVWVIDGAGERALSIAHGHAHAPLGNPEEVVDGAVEGCHDPLKPAVARVASPLLLAHEPVAGPA